MRRIGLFIGLLLVLFRPITGWSQTERDSSRVLGIDDFLEIVSENHPLSKAAELRLDDARATLLKARGGFDPKLYTDLSEKDFKGTDYYRLFDAGLQIPTWFGIDIKAGYEDNVGAFRNPENNTSNAGLWFAGISVPIGEGLFIDQRRADLRKAQLAQGLNEAERQVLINNLLIAAGDSYWNWFMAYNNLKVFENAFDLASIRRDAVVRGAELGDLPPIDTLEAGIQVQNRFLSLEEAKLNYRNATAELSVFLWAEGVIPLEVDSITNPPVFEALPAVQVDEVLEMQMDSMIVNHPELQFTNFKIDQLQIDRRLAKEQLKPTLNLSYKPITEPVGNDIFADFNSNNFEWGLEFSFPILLRKERGELRKQRIKIRNAEFDLMNKQEQLLFKSRKALNKWATTKIQADQYQQTVIDYNRLLIGEQRKFETGESSLFLVNSREVGFIQAQNKLIELLAKNRMSVLETYYSLGLLGQEGRYPGQL